MTDLLVGAEEVKNHRSSPVRGHVHSGTIICYRDSTQETFEVHCPSRSPRLPPFLLADVLIRAAHAAQRSKRLFPLNPLHCVRGSDKTIDHIRRQVVTPEDEKRPRCG